jgi:sugar (pentulose or hexulose) kinase
MQMQSDVSGLPIALTEVGDAVVLGGAILAATGAGLFPSVADAAGAMVHQTHTIEPNPDVHKHYQFFVDAYIDTYPAMRPLIHRMTQEIAEQEAVEA